MSLFGESEEWFGEISKEFKKVVKVNRVSEYETLYKVIEEYINRKPTLVLTDFKRIASFELDSPVLLYEIYSSEPFLDGKELADKVYTDVGKYVVLNTNEYGKEFTLLYDSMVVCKIYGMLNYKGISLMNLISPVVIDGFWSSMKLRYLPPELELIDVYKRLYSPEYFEEWSDLVEIEKTLFNDVCSRNETGEIVGGVACTLRQVGELETLKILIVSKFLVERDIVLIGAWAIIEIAAGIFGKGIAEVSGNTVKLHGEADKKCIEKVQVIVDCDIDKFMEELRVFVRKHSSVKLVCKEQPIHMIKEFRLVKHTVYVVFEDKCGVVEKPLMDVYNAGCYSLIGYTTSQRFMVNKAEASYSKNIKVGNLFVILRFLMLDIWLLKIVQKLDFLTKDVLVKKINMILGYMKFLRKLNVVKSKAFSDHYIGIYESESQAKKKNINLIFETQRKKVYPYIPFVKS